MGDVVEVNDNVFIFAGANLEVEKLSSNKKYWTHVGDMREVLPSAFYYQQFTSVGINNEIYTFGGIGTNSISCQQKS